MSVQVPLIDADAVSAALPADQCIAAMQDVLRSLDRGGAVLPLRTVIRLPDAPGALYTMPAFTTEPRALVVKLITIFEQNRGPLPTHQGLVVVFDPETGRPACLLDAARLTAIRTAAVSACATAALALPGADTLAILGTGVQARSHAEILPRVRPIRSIRIWGRTPARAAELAAELQARQPSMDVSCWADAADAVADAGIICTTTSSPEPVLRGEWIAAGAHINAIGASMPDARELDTAAVARSRIFVDSVNAARSEAGDLIIAARETGTAPEWSELGALLNGRAAGRQSADEVTLFKSVGLAVEDAAAAAVIMRNAGVGP